MRLHTLLAMRLHTLLFIPLCTFLAAQDGNLQTKAEAARLSWPECSWLLQEVLKAQGPEKAIEVCQTEAPAMAEKVGKSNGVRIGRTSIRLRNPSNRVPAWAEALVAAKVAEPRFIQAPDGGMQALLPIRLGQACLACHGSDAGISPGVRSALKAKYPHDQATGYQAGELRGWFWVEVPGRKLP
ncbi:MAG: DUF3365 domain-containing protein [Holophagaceae bacterium]|nr:DUF3365 domain-containing protein [Holophagaceae bacterium]